MTTRKFGVSLAVILPLGLLFSVSAKAYTPKTISNPLLSQPSVLSQQNQLAYCAWRRMCENRCVSYGGRGYHCYYNRWGKRYCNWGSGYCVRWEHYCRNVCYDHYREGYYWHRW